LPTIREAATLMGYPYSYQFLGSETTRWKQIGNSVSPQLSFALAGEIRKGLGLTPHGLDQLKFEIPLPIDKKHDLRHLGMRSFSNRQVSRKKGSKFRRVLVKERNTTLELLNYHPLKDDEEKGKKWYLCLFKGTGAGYRQVIINDCADEIALLQKSFHAQEDVQKIAGLIDILKAHEPTLQAIYENDIGLTNPHNPVVIVEKLRQELISLQTKPTSITKSHTHEFKDVFLGWRQGIIATHFVAAKA
jgi:DNA (cytosine-5)-methyltransferase 1